MFLGFSSCTLSEEHNTRMFQNGLLRRILGHKREEVRKGRRNIHNKELV
jgi:hypothetical protein